MVNLVTIRFNSVYDRVFMDAKWFYLTEVKMCFYLTANEDNVQRSAKSKHYVPKIMFIATVARSRYDTTRVRYEFIYLHKNVVSSV